MVMVLSSRGSHNGCSTGFVARHYTEEKLPNRYIPRKKKKKPRPLNRASTIGQNNGNSILTAEAVYAIRRLCDGKIMSQHAIAAKFKCAISTVGKIARRECWKHLPEKQ